MLFRSGLRGFTRRFHPGKSLWEPLPPVDEVHDRTKLKTVIRYIHLNPCRARKTGDPWDWEFSTLRDHCGLSLDPWMDRERIASATRMRLSEWKDEHEAWVLRDDFVDPEVREKRMSPPDLKTLSPEEVLRTLE